MSSGGIARGASFMLLASFGFAVMGVLVKALSGVVPTGEIVLWRSAVMAVAVSAWALRSGIPVWPGNLPMLLIRGLIGTASMLFYFMGIARLPLGDAVLLTYLSPLIVAGLAPITVGERASPRVWAALGLGFVGVGLVVGPAWTADPVGVVFALLGALFAAGAYLSVRVLARTDHPLAIVFWFSLVGTAATSPTLLDGVAPMDAPTIGAVLTIGLVGAGAQWAMTMAYAAGPAVQVSVYAYATPVFAYLAQVLLGEPPRWPSVAGAALVVIAGVVAADR